MPVTETIDIGDPIITLRVETAGPVKAGLLLPYDIGYDFFNLPGNQRKNAWAHGKIEGV